MITLATAAIIENLIAVVGISNAFKTRHDFSRCRIPINFLEGAIGASSEWRGNTIFTILVVIQTGGFLAEITLRSRMILISANPHYFTIVITPRLHFDTAIKFAQDACTGVPLIF